MFREEEHPDKNIIDSNLFNHVYLDGEISKLLDNTKQNKKTVLILSGGGIKGISHVGALKALEDLNYLKYIKTIAGSSVGGFIGFLYTIGYSPSDMYSFLSLFDFDKTREIDIKNLFENFGLDNGRKFKHMLIKLMENKNISENVTFRELYALTKIKLVITGSCVNNRKTYLFSHETYPDMNVIMSIMITTAYPVYFTPIKFDDKLFVDGGCLNNYPINFFEQKLHKTIGIHITDHHEFTEEINDIGEYLINIIKCITENITCHSEKHYEKYTIRIECKNIQALQINIDRAQKDALYMTGYKSTIDFFGKNDK